ncbi:MAG: twitching motility protein PilT [Deinococcota bacterium]|jgi:hypothetical protein|nr:twitching motility protein PilT [Deinococcota bacterium]
MEDTNSEMVLPLITLAEATIVIERGGTTVPDVQPFLHAVYADPRIEIYPLTLEVFEHSQTPEGLKIPELHDRFIVVTGLHLRALGHVVKMLIKDKAITDAGVLDVLW